MIPEKDLGSLKSRIATVILLKIYDYCNQLLEKVLMLSYCIFMGFWNNVIDELEYQGKSRKWLAEKANIDTSTIGAGIKRNGYPQSDVAVRISKALGVSVEFLVTGKSITYSNETKNIDLHLYKKYIKTMQALENLDPSTRTPIQEMIEKLSATNTGNKS